MAESMRGVVKWFSDARGYGFIQPEPNNGGADVFVHHSVIDMTGYRTLKEGAHVEFELADESGKGPRAQLVRPLP